jgi:hypothetical protein
MNNVKNKSNKKQEFRVSYTIEVDATTPKEACLEVVRILADQIKGIAVEENPDIFAKVSPPVFEVWNQKGKKTVVELDK